MPQIQLNDQLFSVAQRRANDAGFSSVDAYFADMLAHDVNMDDDLNHIFTPELIAKLQHVSARAEAGAKTYSPEEVREHFKKKSDAWQETHSG